MQNDFLQCSLVVDAITCCYQCFVTSYLFTVFSPLLLIVSAPGNGRESSLLGSCWEGDLFLFTDTE